LVKTQNIRSVLVTGVAGFIGFHVASRLLKQGISVVGVDNLNDYYDVGLKKNRLSQLQAHSNFTFHQIDLSDRPKMEAMWAEHDDVYHIIHLAAQAGVRYSLVNPYAYIQSNVMGHLVILELCRNRSGFQHLVYASSSSVYGGNQKMPFSVQDRTDSPLAIYAATKKCDELMSRTYAHLYQVPATGLRFFTVYGPWGRPDMAAYLFADAILAGKPIKVFNHGNMKRDFTYIDDIVAGVLAALNHIPEPDAQGVAHKVYNLGNNNTITLTHSPYMSSKPQL